MNNPYTYQFIVLAQFIVINDGKYKFVVAILHAKPENVYCGVNDRMVSLLYTKF